MEKNETRERWPSRLSFYFAAIGSAVGFGNVWRFPSLVFEYGGGAFFIPYLLALILIGIPILVLEISMGQQLETGSVRAFGSINNRLSGVGVSSIACGYFLVVYYSMLLAWVTHAFFDSFKDNIWQQDDITGTEATSYFYNNIIGMNTIGEDLLPTRIVWKNVACSLIVWTCVFLCVAFGVEVTGKITYVTMGLPIVLLLVFLVRSITLDGSKNGIDQYIGNSNYDIFIEQPEVWSKAASQIFFSLGIAFGIMTAYGSHCSRDEPAFLNSCVIAVSNSMFSFVSGFAVFASLGHLAYVEGINDISELNYSGFGLVFGSWPVILGTLPGGEHWIRMLLLMLFLLGIDSAFSFLEAIVAVLEDTAMFKNVDSKILCLGLTVSAWMLSFLYATDAGLVFLDTVDHYINFILILIGFFETFSAGWVYGIEKQIKILGNQVVYSYIAVTFGSIILACAVGFGSASIWTGFATLVSFYSVGMSVVILQLRKLVSSEVEKWSWKSIAYELLMKNVVQLRDDLSTSVGHIPLVWAFLIKHIIPPVLLILFATLCNAETDEGERVFLRYEGYAFVPYQFLGLSIVLVISGLLLSSVVQPHLYGDIKQSFVTGEANFSVGHATGSYIEATEIGIAQDYEVNSMQSLNPRASVLNSEIA